MGIRDRRGTFGSSNVLSDGRLRGESDLKNAIWQGPEKKTQIRVPKE